LIYPNGSESIMEGVRLVKVKSCPCTDGKARTATTTGRHQRGCTTPAFVKVSGSTVSGYLRATKQGYIFRATGRNAGLLPEEFE
jgi:hypothetical protein